MMDKYFCHHSCRLPGKESVKLLTQVPLSGVDLIQFMAQVASENIVLIELMAQ